jgi:DNA-3-methyladenine glycosylase I
MQKRCEWASSNALYIEYHDNEWGVPVHDDRKIFAMLVLEGTQAGLNWLTVLRKRENYREAFDNFDPRKVAKYDKKKFQKLLANDGIIRNKLKINSAIQNARAFLEVQKEFGSFDGYIWQFVGGRPIRNSWKSLSELPAQTAESEAISKDLKRRGFSFVGPTICYVHMQATGMVNDHVVTCFRYKEVERMR